MESLLLGDCLSLLISSVSSETLCGGVSEEKREGGFFAARQRTVNPSVKSRCAFLPCLFAVNKPDSFVGKGGRTCLARDDLRLPDCFSLSRLFPSPLACHHCSLILRVVPVKAAATSVYVLCHTCAIATISRCIRSFFFVGGRTSGASGGLLPVLHHCSLSGFLFRLYSS